MLMAVTEFQICGKISDQKSLLRSWVCALFQAFRELERNQQQICGQQTLPMPDALRKDKPETPALLHGGKETAIHSSMFGFTNDLTLLSYVPSVQQKSSGLKFSKSQTRSHVTYNCHHNLSHFTFPMFVHSWHFSHPFITINHAMYILLKDTNIFAKF
jgi:hypothetical protein